MGQIVGHVTGLCRFPVKSMAGEPLERAEIDWQGVEGDRQYAFVLSENGTRFPWLTGRNLSAMVLHRARFADPASPKNAPVEVTAPDGWHGSLTDPELKARLTAEAGAPVSLIQLGIGAYDAMPVSIVTSAAHAALEAAHGSALDPRRFRINVTIDSTVSQDEWRGRRLAFGEEDGAALLLADGIPRCAMITIDPDTAARDPSVLRTVAQQFGNLYGVYAAPARKGYIRLGDPVRVID
jgi:uncharacterized protein YcbX